MQYAGHLFPSGLVVLLSDPVTKLVGMRDGRLVFEARMPNRGRLQPFYPSTERKIGSTHPLIRHAARCVVALTTCFSTALKEIPYNSAICRCFIFSSRNSTNMSRVRSSSSESAL